MGIGGDVRSPACNRRAPALPNEPYSGRHKAETVHKKTLEAIPLACFDTHTFFPSGDPRWSHLGEPNHQSDRSS